MTIELKLQRLTGFGQPRTFGEMLDADGVRLVHTLEDEVREVAGEPVSKWKVKAQTAIPAGRYRVIREDSNRFGKGTLTLLDVEGFIAIRMHGGNTESDTEGCPLLGMNKSASGISNCAPAVQKIKDIVAAADKANEEVWLTIVNAE